MTAVGWVDIALLSVLGISVLVGLARGLTYEVLALLGWVAAYVAAHALTPVVLPNVQIGSPESGLRRAVTFGVVFVLALIVWGLATRLLSLLIKSSPLSLFDRVLGAAFGALRALVVLLVVATLVALTPWARSPDWQASTGAVWLNAVLHGLVPLLPPDIARHLPGAGGTDV